ncbi:MAG: glutamate formimidoyltransferase [Deltaproteobacteria bacterium]|nr:glutamate formimidoyltransferase [Deltaproteobacteria bacterium]
MKLVECVPNFSEGRDQKIINAIADAARQVPGVVMLDVDPGAATNRTVYTFAGPPDAVVEAAFLAIKKGGELIDMRNHKGSHARQGACDVCPFVPISEVSMEECVVLANTLAKRVGEELGLPVFLYAEAARRPDRARLPDIRAGEYEALSDKMGRPEWAPEYGPNEFNPKFGVLTAGARPFLIAYNINLNTTSVRVAKEIAFTIRETGRVKKDAHGKTVTDQEGNSERTPGLFKNLQGTGWLIPEYNRAQITVNILNIDTTPLHLVYDKCCELAQNLGVRVTGSEIVGMVPQRVLREAGEYFLDKQGATTGIDEAEIIRNACITLGLSDVTPFDPALKIIENRFEKKRPLAQMTVKDFVGVLASNAPAPGGGSVAALSGALSAGLASMVAALTFDKKGFEVVRPEMKATGIAAQNILRKQMNAIDDDTAAFNRVMEGFAMPKKTEEQKSLRQKAIEHATKEATLEPFGVLERTISSLDLALLVAEKGNQNSLSDAGVGALMARAAAYGAFYNVLINLKGIEDKAWCADIKKKAETILQTVATKAATIEQLMLDRL